MSICPSSVIFSTSVVTELGPTGASARWSRAVETGQAVKGAPERIHVSRPVASELVVCIGPHSLSGNAAFFATRGAESIDELPVNLFRFRRLSPVLGDQCDKVGVLLRSAQHRLETVEVF